MTRTRLRLLAGALLLLGLGVYGYYCYFIPQRAWSDWYRRVDDRIRELKKNRPPDVPAERWDCVVGWTNNLHGNCAPSMSMLDREADPGWQWRVGFEAELERRMAGPLTLADIDWIWDEYVAHTPLGKKYADSYRPTRGDVCPR